MAQATPKRVESGRLSRHACASSRRRHRGNRRMSKDEELTARGDRAGSEQVTLLMDRARQGDRQAASALLPLVYEQLRRTAQRAMA
ncbi:MAG: hypothetical protein K2Q09_03460, partial [Phycisphaerales bacterium]|nr:hypothetical protein [Phycisphaerales bacterium]